MNLAIVGLNEKLTQNSKKSYFVAQLKQKWSFLYFLKNFISSFVWKCLFLLFDNFYMKIGPKLITFFHFITTFRSISILQSLFQPQIASFTSKLRFYRKNFFSPFVVKLLIYWGIRDKNFYIFAKFLVTFWKTRCKKKWKLPYHFEVDWHEMCIIFVPGQKSLLARTREGFCFAKSLSCCTSIFWEVYVL